MEPLRVQQFSLLETGAKLIDMNAIFPYLIVTCYVFEDYLVCPIKYMTDMKICNFNATEAIEFSP